MPPFEFNIAGVASLNTSFKKLKYFPSPNFSAIDVDPRRSKNIKMRSSRFGWKYFPKIKDLKTPGPYLSFANKAISVMMTIKSQNR